MGVIDKLLQESLEAKAEAVRKKIQESLDGVKILGTFKDGAIVLHEGKHYRAYLKDDKIELKPIEESTVSPADIVEDFLSGKPLKKKLDQLIESVAKGTVKTPSSVLKPLIEKLSKLYKDEKEEKEILEAIRVGIRKMRHKVVPAQVRAKRKAYYRRNRSKILRAVKQWAKRNKTALKQYRKKFRQRFGESQATQLPTIDELLERINALLEILGELEDTKDIKSAIAELEYIADFLEGLKDNDIDEKDIEAAIENIDALLADIEELFFGEEEEEDKNE